MPRDATKRACLTLKSRQLEALKGLSRKTGAPVAELARRAVEAYLVAHVHGHELEPDHPGSAQNESDRSRPSSADSYAGKEAAQCKSYDFLC